LLSKGDEGTGMSEGQFHDRFGIHVDMAEAKRRFVNRVNILIFSKWFYEIHESQRSNAIDLVPFYLGVPQKHQVGLDYYSKGQFLGTLNVIEALYRSIKWDQTPLTKLVQLIIMESELDLGIEWTGSVFVPKGAHLLDVQVVEDVLTWLKDKKYQSVYDPFTKALHHLLESQQAQIRLFDVITDCYEAVEAMAMITSGNRKDLSGNRDLFVNGLNVSEPYKKMLRETVKKFIEYGNHYRHAKESDSPRLEIGYFEAESYMYFSGTIIRLATKTIGDS